MKVFFLICIIFGVILCEIKDDLENVGFWVILIISYVLSIFKGF